MWDITLVKLLMTTQREFCWSNPGFLQMVISFHFRPELSGKEVKNYVSSKHLEAYKDWLLLSDVKRGMYCKYCPWFINRNEGGYQKNVPLGALVTKPLTNFKNLTGVKSDLEIHCSNIYHKNASNFRKRFS